MNHAPSVVIVSWQRSEHGYISLRYKTCCVSSHRLMTMVRAWLFNSQVWNMLRQLLSWHDNCQSMVIYPLGMNHAPSVVIISWQRSEHGYISLRHEPCSVSCYRLMTTVRAWLYIIYIWNMLCSWQWTEQVRNMLCQLWSFRDSGQSMVIPLSGKNHAPSVVIV